MSDDLPLDNDLDRDKTRVGNGDAPREETRSLGDDKTRGEAEGLPAEGLEQILTELFYEVIDFASRFEIEAELGKGGMGAVQLATDRKLKRQVAIKRILGPMARSPSALKRFVTEAQSIGQLDHENIIDIYDYGRDRDGPFLIMQFVAGGSLLDRLQEGKLEVKAAVSITCQLCGALTLAHQKGIIHRDIKPANILLTEDGVPKLTDFGLARDQQADHGQTITGAVMGTLDFMPPEQRQDATAVDACSDLWSLAATLYQMLTGKSPKVIRLDQLPAELRNVLGKALEETPVDRYQTAGEFRDALMKAIAAPGENRTKKIVDGDICPGCESVNIAGAKFCVDCGMDMTAFEKAELKLDEGVAYLQQGDYKKSYISFTAAIRLWSNYGEAYCQLGLTCLKHPEYQDLALGHFNSAMTSGLESERVYLGRGDAYQNRGEYAKAIADYGKAIERDPRLGEAHLKRARIYQLQDDYDLALADYSEAIRLSPEQVDAFSDRASLYLGREEYGKAVADASEAIRIAPDADAYLIRAKAYRHQAKLEEVVEDLTEVIELSPGDAAAYADRGEVLFEQGEYKRAVDDFSAAILNEPDNVKAHLGRGGAYTKQDKHDKALADYSEVIHLDPEQADAFSQRASIYFRREEYEKTVADASEAIKLRPGFVEAYYNRARAFGEQGEYDQEVADYSQVIRLQPDHVRAYYYRAVAHGVHGEYRQSVVDCTEAIRLDPSYFAAYQRRGLLHHAQNANDLAIADFSELIRLQPEDAEAHFNRGVVYGDQDDYDQAIADYTRAIERDADYGEAYDKRGIAYNEQDEYDLAISDFSEVIRLDPENAEAHCNRGIARIEENELAEAIIDFGEAIRLDRDSLPAYYHRGEAYSRRQEFAKAIADFKKVIRSDQGDEKAYLARGIVHASQGSFRKAISDFTVAIELNPGDNDALRWRGTALGNLGKYDEAVADYSKAIRLDPDDAEAYHWRGVTYIWRRDLELAIADNTRAIWLKPDFADAYHNRGVVYFEQREYAKAIADYSKALLLQPNDVDVLQSRGNVYKKIRDKAKAKFDFARVKELNRKLKNQVKWDKDTLVEYQRSLRSARRAKARFLYSKAAEDFEKCLDLLEQLLAENEQGDIQLLGYSSSQEALSVLGDLVVACQKAELAIEDLSFAVAQPATVAGQLLYFRGSVLAERGDHRGAAEAGETLAGLDIPVDPLFKALAHDDDDELDPAIEVRHRHFYNAACLLSLALAVARESTELTGDEEETIADGYSARVMELLELLRNQGYFKHPGKISHLQNDPDLDGISDSMAFRQFLDVVLQQNLV